MTNGAEVVFPLSLGILVVWNIVQFIFWSKQVHRLIDKVMSRNYAEFVQAERTRGPSLVKKELGKLPESEQVEEEKVLQELNGLFGL